MNSAALWARSIAPWRACCRALRRVLATCTPSTSPNTLTKGCCQSGSKPLASCCRRRASSASPATRTRPLPLLSPCRALASSGSCASTPARLLRTARSASCASTGPTRSWSPSTLMRIASAGASRVRSICRPSRLASAWRVSGSSASARFRAICRARPATGEGLEQERAMHAFYLRGWGLGPGCRAAGLPGCRAAARHPW